MAAPILVVDDDPALRGLFTMVLESDGFATLEAENGRAALELLATRPVSLVLLDNRMPELTGLEVLRRIRRDPATRTLPVILVTGLADTRDRVEGLDAGADDYVVKPVDLDELRARVRAQLRGQAAWLRRVTEAVTERGRVAAALCRLRPEASPALTAARVCAEVTAGHHGAVAVILAIGYGDEVTVLNARGAGALRAGTTLPPPIGRALRARARGGAWVDSSADPTPELGELGNLPAPLALAPLLSHGRMLGMLVLAGGLEADPSPGLGDPAGRQLAAAVDYASVASVLLASALEERRERASVARAVVQVLDDGSFTPVFQPIVSVASGPPVGFEALTRFADGTAPDARFEAAAEVGLGLAVERATMLAAVEAASALPPDTWLSLNATPELLLEADDLAVVLQRADRPVVIELTEQRRIDEYPPLLAALTRLGPDVRLSIDDAGSGYACLAHVLAMRPAFVKLDRVWVAGIETDPIRQALIAGLCHFAREAGCELIAEGVEHPSELSMLRSLDVPLAQGFLLGRPAPAKTAYA